jgi:hypothetical protein
MMRSCVRYSSLTVAIAALALCAGVCAKAQSTTTQPPATPTTQAPIAGNGTYIVVDPLAGVRYDNRWDLSVGLGYDHMKAGPTLLEGSNLGGLDITGSYWLSKHWAAEATLRPYLGTSGAGVNPYGIEGPFVAQYIFAGGAEYLGPHNKHGALIAHALIGGSYGKFEGDLHGIRPALVDFYPDQIAPAAIIGGHIDLNRSPRWVFRITPDAIMTHYGTDDTPKGSQFDVNFAISVGVEYKFKKKR